jgi:MoaA/NifB/PqqE/SkfB family radical SAM enzyme
MLERLKDSLYRRLGYTTLPTGIDLKLTQACNLSCRYCPHWGPDGIRPDPVVFMDTQAMLGLVHEVAPFRLLIRLIGGEPLLHPEWHRVIETAGEYGIWTTAVSNGTLIADQAERLVDSGLDNIGVSIDGPAPVHDAQRGKGSWAAIAEGITELNRIKRERGSETPMIEIYTTIHQGNYDQLVGLAEDLRSWGIWKYRLQQLIWASPEQFEESLALLRSALPGVTFFGADMAYCKDQSSGVDPDTLTEQLEMVKSRDYPFEIELHPNLPPAEWSAYHSAGEYQRRHGITCTIMESYAFVDPIGRLHPCMTIDFGNVFEQSFAKVWNGARFRAFRRLIRRNGRLPFCHRCPD